MYNITKKREKLNPLSFKNDCNSNVKYNIVYGELYYQPYIPTIRDTAFTLYFSHRI